MSLRQPLAFLDSR